MRVLKLILAAMLALGIFPLSAQTVIATDAASDYPKRPIRMLVPNAPGSSSDVLVRLLALKLGEVIGQQVVVENHAGAGGQIGMEMGKNAAPDGYTIIVTSPPAMTILPNLRKTPYDPLNDFQFVSLFAVLPNMLVVTPALPIKTVQELIDYTKSKPGQINMASAGPGSQSHLTGEMLKLMGNFPSVHVPYKGGGPSVLSVVSGETQWSINPAAAVMGHVNSGRLRAIAHSLPQRTPLLAGIPAIGESIPGFSYSAWNGMLLPKGTPAPIVEKLRAALLKTLMLAEVREFFGKQGAEVVTNTSEEFRKMVEAEIESTGKVVKAAGLKVD